MASSCFQRILAALTIFLIPVTINAADLVEERSFDHGYHHKEAAELLERTPVGEKVSFGYFRNWSTYDNETDFGRLLLNEIT